VAEISLDYTARDFDAVIQELVRQAQQVIPNWEPRGEGDFVLMLLQTMAAAVDLSNYYVDRVLGESTLATATTRSSVLALAEQLGYIAHGAIAAKAEVTLVVESANGNDITVPRGTKFLTNYQEAVDGPVAFELDEDVVVPGNGDPVTVTVTEGQTIAPYQAAVGTGEAHQVLTLPNYGIIEGSVRVWVEAPHANIEWIRIPRLIDAGPDDRVFITRLLPNGSTAIMFGDGITGRIPELGAKIYVSYRVGVGRAGNVGPGTIQYIASDTVTGVRIARDAAGRAMSTAATGGSDPEDSDEIRRNAPQAFAAQYRCVSTEDFARLALEVPGVSAAKAVSARSGSVTVFIAGPDRSTPNADLIATTQEHLQAHALAGTKVSVSGPTFVKVNFGTEQNPLRVHVAPGWRDILVKATVEAELAKIFRADEVTFGTRVTLAQIYTRLSALPGVINVNIPLMAREDAPQVGADDAVMEPYEMPVLGDVHIATVGGVITPV